MDIIDRISDIRFAYLIGTISKDMLQVKCKDGSYADVDESEHINFRDKTYRLKPRYRAYDSRKDFFKEAAKHNFFFTGTILDYTYYKIINITDDGVYAYNPNHKKIELFTYKCLLGCMWVDDETVCGIKLY